MHLCVDLCTLFLCPQRPKVSDSLEMELETVVSSLVWVFDPVQISRGAVCVVNHLAISRALNTSKIFQT